MTLILTMISGLGIVHVSDSNLSDEHGLPDGTGKKLFRLRRLNAGIACAGSFAVNGIRMDEWMPARISEYETYSGATLAGFADWIRGSLEHDMTPKEKAEGCWLHISGFVNDQDGVHPVLFVVSNVPAIDDCGQYLPAQQVFRPLEEEFWVWATAAPEHLPYLAAGGSRITINGLPDGRIAYLGLADELQGFLKAIWSHPEWLFRPARTLDDTATFLSLHLSVIVHLFQMSDYPGPIIGGETQRLLIAPPEPEQP